MNKYLTAKQTVDLKLEQCKKNGLYRMSEDDLKLLQHHAAIMKLSKKRWKLLCYHKRRQRSLWFTKEGEHHFRSGSGELAPWEEQP